MELIFGLLILAIVGVVSFFGTALLVYGICWAFALTFTWKIAFGIWVVLILARSVFSVTVNKK